MRRLVVVCCWRWHLHSLGILPRPRARRWATSPASGIALCWRWRFRGAPGRPHAHGSSAAMAGAGLFVWFCCSCFWSVDTHATLASLRGYVQVMMAVWLVWELAETPGDLRDLLRCYVAGSWVLAVLTMANLASPEAQARSALWPRDRTRTTWRVFWILAFPMAALLLDAESRWAGKVLAFGYLPLGLVGVLLTASRGGCIAAVVALAGCGADARSHRSACWPGRSHCRPLRRDSGTWRPTRRSTYRHYS